MNLQGVTFQLRLEELARRLARKYSDEGSQGLVTPRVHLAVRVAASVRPMCSLTLSPMPSSFGHDTPAHVERRCGFRVLVLQWMSSTECGSNASTRGRRVAVTA